MQTSVWIYAIVLTRGHPTPSHLNQVEEEDTQVPGTLLNSTCSMHQGKRQGNHLMLYSQRHEISVGDKTKSVNPRCCLYEFSRFNGVYTKGEGLDDVGVLIFS